jgi:hypothetical protein
MLTVWFIGHGESERNAGLASRETASSPLTAKGAGSSNGIDGGHCGSCYIDGRSAERCQTSTCRKGKTVRMEAV